MPSSTDLQTAMEHLDAFEAVQLEQIEKDKEFLLGVNTSLDSTSSTAHSAALASAEALVASLVG